MPLTSDPGPRLLRALGLDAEEVRGRRGVDATVEDEVAAGLDYWVPTLANRPVDQLTSSPRPGRADPLDPRAPVTAGSRGRHRRSGRRRDRRPAPLETPAAVRGARWEAARPALAGLIVVAVCVGVVLGARVWTARTDAEPRDLAPGAGVGQSVATGVVARATATFGTAPPATGVGGTGRLRVHVVGRVRAPKVVVLPVGSRVEEAVRAAGGFASGADQGAVNLARPLVDGEQVRIPAPGEETQEPTVGAAQPSGSTGPAKVALNTADAAALDSLPGVGEVLAGRILAWRQEHGRFSTVEELGEVSGIGEKLLAQLTPLVTV